VLNVGWGFELGCVHSTLSEALAVRHAWRGPKSSDANTAGSRRASQPPGSPPATLWAGVDLLSGYFVNSPQDVSVALTVIARQSEYRPVGATTALTDLRWAGRRPPIPLPEYRHHHLHEHGRRHIPTLAILRSGEQTVHGAQGAEAPQRTRTLTLRSGRHYRAWPQACISGKWTFGLRRTVPSPHRHSVVVTPRDGAPAVKQGWMRDYADWAAHRPT